LLFISFLLRFLIQLKLILTHLSIQIETMSDQPQQRKLRAPLKSLASPGAPGVAAANGEGVIRARTIAFTYGSVPAGAAFGSGVKRKAHPSQDPESLFIAQPAKKYPRRHNSAPEQYPKKLETLAEIEVDIEKVQKNRDRNMKEFDVTLKELYRLHSSHTHNGEQGVKEEVKEEVREEEVGIVDLSAPLFETGSAASYGMECLVSSCSDSVDAKVQRRIL
jgi:hypothetical protein